MENKVKNLRRQKIILTILHLIFLVVMVLGISAMYLNGGYGKGIRWIFDEIYEDSDSFCMQLGSDVNKIFTYVGYKDMFETNGVLDMHKPIVRISDGPGLEDDMTLDQVVRYAKIRGYYLGEDFTVQGSPMSMEDDDLEITVDYQSVNPGLANAGEMEDRMTKEELALDILAHLGEYYSIYYNFIDNQTNVRFRVVYRANDGRETVYTNVPNMSLDELRGFGKYLFIPGNTIRMDTNLAMIPDNAASLLETWNPYDNDQNYMIVSVDTTYPYDDNYAQEAREYRDARKTFIAGMGGVAAGLIGVTSTLIALVLLSGHTRNLDDEIRLFPSDESATELCILTWGILTVIALFLGKRVGTALIQLLFSEEQQAYWNRVLQYLILYGCGTLCGFSLLRRYKAGRFWRGSLLKQALEAAGEYRGHMKYASAAGLGYLLFLGCNAALMWSTLLLFVYRHERLAYRLLLYVCTAVFVGLDLWVFHRIFRKTSQRDLLDEAIHNLSQGDTGYRIPVERLSGKERFMGENINHISSGMDTALQEKVRSERLKADLITNVSHDIKTPLTSIINYVDLLKRQKIQDPKIAAYLEVLDQKSQRLKTLTEDLVEASKASSGNLKLEVSDINLVELVQQTNGEFEERFALRHLELIQNLPDQVLLISADGRRLWRVLENLYTNAFKYAMENSRVYVAVEKREDRAVFTIKNISDKPLNISPEELTERFVRGDVARTTEGSGLGLSIARSLAQLQKGEFNLIIDGDLFKAEVSFPLKEPEKHEEAPEAEESEPETTENEGAAKEE